MEVSQTALHRSTPKSKPYFALLKGSGLLRTLTGSKHRVLQAMDLYRHADAFQQTGRRICWPSVTTIARDLAVSDRTVQRAMRWLESRGFIRKYIDHDRDLPNKWELTIPGTSEEKLPVTGASVVTGGVTVVSPGGVTNRAPHIRMNTQLKILKPIPEAPTPTPTPTQVPTLFDATTVPAAGAGESDDHNRKTEAAAELRRLGIGEPARSEIAEKLDRESIRKVRERWPRAMDGLLVIKLRQCIADLAQGHTLEFANGAELIAAEIQKELKQFEDAETGFVSRPWTAEDLQELELRMDKQQRDWIARRASGVPLDAWERDFFKGYLARVISGAPVLDGEKAFMERSGFNERLGVSEKEYFELAAEAWPPREIDNAFIELWNSPTFSAVIASDEFAEDRRHFQEKFARILKDSTLAGETFRRRAVKEGLRMRILPFDLKRVAPPGSWTRVRQDE